jgi:cyclic-di-GMP phosphodiesterase TipF (flagellum assembly factor)
MASIANTRTGKQSKVSNVADLIVKGAIALVTAAFFIGAYLQFQVSFWLALIAALSVYITLLMLHTLMRRSERVDVLVSEVSRLESELAAVKGREGGEYAPRERGAPPAARGSAGAAGGPPPPRLDTKPSFARPERAAAPASPPAVGTEPPSLGPVRPAAPAQPELPPFKASAQEPAAAQPDLSPNLPPWPNQSGAEDLHDYWSFRPERPQFQEAQFQEAQFPEAQDKKRDERRNEARPPEGADRETDLEAVQGMIKRLASEVSLGDANAPDAGRSRQEGALRASVDALHSTADSMRAASSKKGASAAPRRRADAGPATPPPIAPGHARLSSVAEAIAARRLDVFMEPIVGLADHQLHHYELIVLARDEKGTALALAGQDRQLSRTGLLPLIDAARLKWASKMAASFAETRRKHRVFAAASAESLTADRFLDELATAYRQREALSSDLVLVFSHADVKAFSGLEWSALADMRDLGFRFGLTEVADLDYEFTALQAAGFAFVKLDAASLSKGLPGPGGLMPAGDICRYLSELGLSVIADQIGEEAMRTAVVEAGAPLGQGPLFGPPVSVETAAVGAGIAAA